MKPDQIDKGSVMSQAIDLTVFCEGENGFRPYLRTPFTCDAGVAATDGHIFVCVPDDTAEFGRCENTAVKELIDQFAINAQAAFKAREPVAASAIEIPTEPKCEACEGVGKISEAECDDCGGDGEFDHGSHTYECQECEGGGRHVTPGVDGDGEACLKCKGAGNAPVTVPFPGSDDRKHGIGSPYLRLIQSLPGAEIFAPSISGGMYFFRFAGGFGGVMPRLQGGSL